MQAAPAWQVALRSTQWLLSSFRLEDACRARASCEEAMRLCLLHGKPTEALEAYYALCMTGVSLLQASDTWRTKASTPSSHISTASRLAGSGNGHLRHGDGKCGSPMKLGVSIAPGCETRASPARKAQTARSAIRCGPLESKSMDELAILALRLCPHRTLLVTTVAQLLAAESDLDGGLDSQDSCLTDITVSAGNPKGSTGRAVAARTPAPVKAPTKHPSDRVMGETPSAYSALVSDLPVAEQFRVQLRQNLFLLQSTNLLPHTIGRNYLLAQVRRIANDSLLTPVVETKPLVCIGMELLAHPFVFKQPASERARRALLHEDIGSFSTRCGLSEAQREKVRALEDSIASIRTVCNSPVEFLHTHAAAWDSLLVEHIAREYVIPDAAHSVLPPKLQHRRPTPRVPAVLPRSSGHRAARPVTSTYLGPFGPTPIQAARAIPQAAPSPELAASGIRDAHLLRRMFLFGGHQENPGNGLGSCSAEERVNYLLHRRRLHDIVVPDVDYALSQFPQLVQLARHREVVLSHTTLLGLAEACGENSGPRRFNARRVLRHFLVEAYRGLETDPPRRCSAKLSPFRCGGVTLLGLQDELELLEHCEERLYLSEIVEKHLDEDNGSCDSPGRAAGCGDGSLGTQLSSWVGLAPLTAQSKPIHLLQEQRRRMRQASWRTVLVSKEIETRLAALRHACSSRNPPSRSPRCSVSAHQRVDTPPSQTTNDPLDRIVNNLNFDEEDALFPSVHGKQGHGCKSPPLFRQRSGATTQHSPATVVIATRSSVTRQLAYSVGLRLFPPVFAA